MNHDWVRQVVITKLALAFKNRATLGVAGTRMLNALRTCRGYFKENMPDLLQEKKRVLLNPLIFVVIHHKQIYLIFFSYYYFFKREIKNQTIGYLSN